MGNPQHRPKENLPSVPAQSCYVSLFGRPAANLPGKGAKGQWNINIITFFMFLFIVVIGYSMTWHSIDVELVPIIMSIRMQIGTLQLSRGRSLY